MDKKVQVLDFIK